MEQKQRALKLKLLRGRDPRPGWSVCGSQRLVAPQHSRGPDLSLCLCAQPAKGGTAAYALRRWGLIHLVPLHIPVPRTVQALRQHPVSARGGEAEPIRVQVLGIEVGGSQASSQSSEGREPASIPVYWIQAWGALVSAGRVCVSVYVCVCGQGVCGCKIACECVSECVGVRLCVYQSMCA